MRYDKVYLRAPKSWRVASLICRTEPNKNSNEETKNKRRDAQKKRFSNKVRGVMQERQSVVEKTERLMDGSELTGWEDVVGAWTEKSETKGVKWGWRTELGWFQRHDEEYLKKRSVIRNEDDVGGRARVTRNEERVLRGGWNLNRDEVMQM